MQAMYDIFSLRGEEGRGEEGTGQKEKELFEYCSANHVLVSVVNHVLGGKEDLDRLVQCEFLSEKTGVKNMCNENK